MELQSPTTAKKLWNLVRVALFMIRKGLLSKRKLLLDMNLMMKKGRFLTKSWAKNLAFINNHSKTVFADPVDGISVASDHYEYSCSNTPSPSFHLKASSSNSKRKHHVYFPCLGRLEENDESFAAETPRSLPLIGYSRQDVSSPVNELSPLPSPFAVKVTNYSSEDVGEGASGGQVDVAAEDFIRRFYEQLRAQIHIPLIEHDGETE